MQYPLPDAFLNRMKEILNDPESFDAFLASYDRHPERGLRLNLKKILSLETSSQENVITYDQIIREFGLHPIPDASSVEYQGKIYYREFYMDEAFLEEKNLRPGHHPYHDAGLYYIQSPEAMQVVNHLNIRPFDRVIDLCASPGGKSTQAADCLSQKAGGFIISNEYVALRARTLSSNFERMGIRNGAVINEDTSRIAAQFPEFFTRVIVDAPCSGEGMFRKDPKSIEEWSPENVETCAARQKEIVENAVHMLAPGGLMSYSTCTYETCENEDIVRYILEHFPGARIENEICAATRLRQEAVTKIEKDTDLIIVVGHQKSSNSNKLFEIAKSNYPNAFVLMVNDLDELSTIKDIETKKKAAVISGASTPQYVVEDIYKYLLSK